MYRVCVKKEFIAQHYLIGGDWGDENHPHSHHFVLDLELAGSNLDQHGYLFDIALIKEKLDSTVKEFQDKLLNDRPEFKDLNPSVEHFCRIIADKLIAYMVNSGVQSLTVRLWEDKEAWASYEIDLTK
ncbi:MAG: 6-pyruvoyl trahydropterin synthase family protein [Oligoflexus sp.]